MDNAINVVEKDKEKMINIDEVGVINQEICLEYVCDKCLRINALKANAAFIKTLVNSLVRKMD